MRKILLGFMTLLMLTPVLTCVMAFCPMQSAQAAEPKPCHQSKDSKSEDSQKEGPMLVLDCMGVDLFQHDAQADVVQPDSSVDIIYFAWADLAADYNFLPSNIHFIRGPPFDSSPPHINNHDLYLTTQRLRI